MRKHKAKDRIVPGPGFGLSESFCCYGQIGRWPVDTLELGLSMLSIPQTQHVGSCPQHHPAIVRIALGHAMVCVKC